MRSPLTMGMGDDVATDDLEDTMTNGRTAFNLSDDESLDSSGNNDDAISLITTTSSIKTAVPKKRVQFLPDDFLVRVREIPPRSNKSSSESDGSASESSDSDGSDTESATDSEDVSSERDTPSPAPVESQNRFNTMPPLMYAAKGSYHISKQNTVKSSNNVAKITGIHPSAISQSSNRKPQPKKIRRSPSPKLEKRSRKTTSKTNEKVHSKKTAHQNENIKANKKRTPLKVKEGRISPPPPAKQTKNTASAKPNNSSVKLFQRRGSGTVSTKPQPVKKQSQSTVSTSVTALSSTSPSSDTSVDRVSRAMQSLSMGKLYTLDGFIFPPHHAKELHLPELSSTSKSEDFDRSVSISTPKRTSVDLSSPRRSYPESGHPHQTPPQSANRKRRFYAWQMANGSIQNALHSTPNIYQLWESPGRSNSDSMEKVLNNGR